MWAYATDGKEESVKHLLSVVRSRASPRRWELLAYPLAAAAAAAVSLVPGKTVAYDDPGCENCYWIDWLRYRGELKWCYPPGVTDECSILYPNYEYSRDVDEYVCEDEISLCFKCTNVYESGCCIWLKAEPPCCDEWHWECPEEAC